MNAPQPPPESGPQPPALYEPGDAPGLREYLDLFRRRWWLVALAGLLGLAAGWWNHQREVPRYTAETLLQREAEQSTLSGLGLMEESAAGDDLASQLEILRSRAVLAPVVDSLGLRVVLGGATAVRGELIADVEIGPGAEPADYRLAAEGGRLVLRSLETDARVAAAPPGGRLDGPGFRVRVGDAPRLEDPVGLSVLHAEAAFERLRDGVRANQVQRTNLIRVRYTSPDAALAAAVVNEVARSYQRYSARRARDEARRRRAFIGEQLAQVADSLRGEQRRLQRYQERSGLLDPAIEGETLAGRLMQTEAELRRIRFRKGILEGALAALRSDEGSADAFQRLVALGGDVLPAGQSLYDRLRELEIERERLTASRFGYTESGPRVEVLDSLIAVTRGEMRAVTQQSLSLLEDREAEAEERADELRGEVGRLPAQAGAFGRLKQEVDAAQEIFNLLSGKYYEAQIAEAVEAGAVEIVDRAPVPVLPNPTNGLRTLLFALLVGLFFGGGAAVLLERLDTTVRDRDEAEEAAGLNVLGMIPRLDGGIDANGARAPTPDAADAFRPAAEAFRSLRTMLRFARTEPPGVIAVTSAVPASGKSTTAENLAIVLAQQGSDVLLVDADLRRPALHGTLGLERAPGLSDVLVGDTDLDDAIRPAAAAAHPVHGLSVLPCGSAVPNPAELLGDDAFRDLVAAARGRFDTVVVDTPPLLAVTDAAVIGQVVDGTLVLAIPGETERQALADAVDGLRRVRAPLLGLVLNKVRVGRYDDYYGDGEPREPGLGARLKGLGKRVFGGRG